MAFAALTLFVLSCKKEGLEPGVFSGNYTGTLTYQYVDAEGNVLEEMISDDIAVVSYHKKNYSISLETVELIEKEELDDSTYTIIKNDGRYRKNYYFAGNYLSIKINNELLSGPIERWNFVGER